MTVKLSVIIPVYNEVNTIEEVLNKVTEHHIKNIEIIVIDDGSNDGSNMKLKEIFKNKQIPLEQLIVHKKNQGKGAAIHSGVSICTGDIIIIQDADLEYDPSEYDKLISPLLNDKADVVYGSRFKGDNETRVLFFWHRLGNSFLTFLSNMLSNLNLTDIETGYKAFRKEIIKKITIEEKRFGVEPEITAKISKLNCRIFEVGISYYGRTYEQGKKIGWKDGISAIRCIIKYNLFR